MSEQENPFAFDPFDPAQTQDQWEQLSAMRREAPVSRPIAGFVYLARYADVKTAFRDAETFSSREGFRGPGIEVPEEESFLGEIDPPAHPRLRTLLMQAFRPGLEKRAEPFAREYTEGRLGAIAAQGGGDLVSEFGIHLPAAVTAHVLGIPTDEIERVGHWGFELLHSTWPATNRTERGEGLEGAFPEFAHFLDDQIASRRLDPNAPDDLITRMVRAKEKGRVLSATQIRTICANTLLASQSTANLVGNLLYRLLTDGGFARALADDRALIPAAIEESLRFEPPVLFLFRTAKVDTELGGAPIAKGERLILGIASGNRDESVYERADEFWMQRGWPDVPEHLTFGPGPHLCLGNQLARMEARVVLETMLDRFEAGSVTLPADYEREFVPMFLEYGPERLPASFASPMREAPAPVLEPEPEPEVEELPAAGAAETAAAASVAANMEPEIAAEAPSDLRGGEDERDASGLDDFLEPPSETVAEEAPGPHADPDPAPDSEPGSSSEPDPEPESEPEGPRRARPGSAGRRRRRRR